MTPTLRHVWPLAQAAFATIGLACSISVTRAATAETLTYDSPGRLILRSTLLDSAPWIRRQPQPQVVPPGRVAVFEALVEGSQPLAFQWQFNSNAVPGGASASLIVSNITAADAGWYRVLVSNSLGSVTSSNALLNLDADRDGLGDSWEVANWNSLTHQTGLGDFDQDGVSNLDEFREGTSPKAANSLNPRLTILSDFGAVSVTPDLPYYTNGTTVTLLGIPNPGLSFISYLGQGFIYNVRTNPAKLTLNANRTVRALFGVPISSALDATNGWRLDGGGWYGQTNVTHDGVDALQSSRLFGPEQSLLELTNVMSAAGTTTFWWKIDATSADELRFFVNGIRRSGTLIGQTDWQRQTYYVPAGSSVSRWTFVKGGNEVSEYNGLLNAPTDAAWLDEVRQETWPDPNLDADTDGMPDLWEYQHFDSAGAMPSDDSDRDGVSNLDEFLDKTDPANSASLLPRLILITTTGGTVEKSPNKPKYAIGERVDLRAVPDPGNHFVIWSGDVAGTSLTTNITMVRHRSVKATFGLPLILALDAPALTWTRGGKIGFYGQTETNHDGVDAAQSGPTGFREDSWMETTVAGPSVLSFWWKAATGTSLNAGTFSVDGVVQAGRISGNVDWQPQVYPLAAGAHTLRWSYSNATAILSLTNGVWVDQVALLPDNAAPVILQHPRDTTAFAGSNVVFSVIAAGTPPLTFEWFANDASLGASTDGALRLSAVGNHLDGARYRVRVANANGGVVSESARLSVLPVPPINDQFANRALLSETNEATGYNIGATAEAGEPAHDGFAAEHSIWWRWTAPTTGRYRLTASSRGSAATLVAGLYSGAQMASLASIVSTNRFATLGNGVHTAVAESDFNATGGVEYAVALDSFFAAFEFLSVRIEPMPGPVLGTTDVNASGEFSFSFSAAPGTSYRIESAEDLLEWTTVASGTVPATGTVSYAEKIDPTGAQRYYRVVLNTP